MEALVHMRKMGKAMPAAEYWASDDVSTYDRHVVVKQLCFTKQAGHVDLAHAIERPLGNPPQMLMGSVAMRDSRSNA